MRAIHVTGILVALAVIAGFGTAVAQTAPGGGRVSNTVYLDAPNNSLVIRTTPRNHRRIADLVRRIAEGKLKGEKVETRVFNVMNMSPEQLFKIIEFQRPTFQRDTTLVFAETANGLTIGN